MEYAASPDKWKRRLDGGWYGGPRSRKTGSRKTPLNGSVHDAVSSAGVSTNQRTLLCTGILHDSSV